MGGWPPPRRRVGPVRTAAPQSPKAEKPPAHRRTAADAPVVLPCTPPPPQSVMHGVFIRH